MHVVQLQKQIDKLIYITLVRYKYSILNSQFKCTNCKNWYKPKYSRLLLILGALETLKREDYNSSISSDFIHSEFISLLDDAVENLNNK